VLELEQLPFGHSADGVCEEPQHVEVAVFHGHRGRAREEEVANEDGAPVAPKGIGGRPPAPQLGSIHDIVVNQRRGVQELDGRGQLYPARSGVAAELRGEEQQPGANALAPRGEHGLSEASCSRIACSTWSSMGAMRSIAVANCAGPEGVDIGREPSDAELACQNRRRAKNV
jgi:hypothetical protein